MSNERFKFRAWNGEAMEYGGFSVHATAGKILIDAPGLTLVTEQSPLMQSTGLHDKNGKEIFEGDIVRYMDAYDTSTESGFDFDEFDNVGEICWEPTKPGWAITFRETIGDDDFWESLSEAEVIGNIYENPDLLK
jgi:uncharacterized phage protein (TIGR01671 family)